MRDPPQKWEPKKWILACQGQLPAEAFWPPTTLMLSGDLPHPGGKRLELRATTHWRREARVKEYHTLHFIGFTFCDNPIVKADKTKFRTIWQKNETDFGKKVKCVS